MKPVVFMCLTIVGMCAGLYVGARTDPGISSYRSGSTDEQRVKQAKHFVWFTLGGAAIGAGFGWAACHVEKWLPNQ